ncbi:MAG: ATP-binding protein [Candidatus Thiodiazotropha sp.]
MNQRTDSCERRLRRKDGSTLWVLISATPVVDESGQFKGSFAMVTDITARKQMEKELLDARTLFEGVVEQSPVPMAMVKNTGELIFNQACVDFLQISDEPNTVPGILLQNLKASWKDYDTQGNFVPHEAMPLARALQGEVTRNLEMQVVRKDGSRRWEMVSGSPIYDNENNLIAGFVTFPDITESKEAEHALQQRERFAQSLLRLSRRLEQAQSSGEVVGAAQDEVAVMLDYRFLAVYLLCDDKSCFKVLDKSGSLSDKISENVATLPIAGDPMLEAIAASQEIVVVEDAESDPRTNKDLVQAMGLRTIVNVPIFLSDRRIGTLSTGTYGSQGVRCPSLTEQEYLTALASHMAVTLDRMQLLMERRHVETEVRTHKEHLEEMVAHRTEELRLARDEAESANKAKSVFLANMSHELRTPLNAILGFSHLMRQDETLSRAQHDNLKIINQSGEHLLKLINDVLEIAKIEAGKLQLEIRSLDLEGLVREVVEMMQLRAREKGLWIVIDQESEFPRYIKGDEARLRQILVNLLGNALKFTEQGGVIVRIGVKANTRQYLRIEIEDTGPGIGEADRARLFRPFVQLGETSSLGGTGLGLSIVLQYAELMGGTASVESEPGKGSLFRVELPLEVVNPSEMTEPDEVHSGDVTGLAPGEPLYRILIAEDQPDNQRLLVRLMEDLGYEARIAENGADCVEQFDAWHPHLIWMDRRMPIMDGLEATREIRGRPGGDAVKIVMVTASAFKEEELEMSNSGVDDYVRKPFRFSDIHSCLTKQLGVRFQYRYDHSDRDAKRGAQSLQALSRLDKTLRRDLEEALHSLDQVSIRATVERIAHQDAALGRELRHRVDNFAYPSILEALISVPTDPH